VFSYTCCHTCQTQQSAKSEEGKTAKTAAEQSSTSAGKAAGLCMVMATAARVIPPSKTKTAVLLAITGWAAYTVGKDEAKAE
jgi:hypothetical protein